MTPTMRTALQERRVLIVGLVSIALPDRRICLADGSIAVPFDGATFTGRDAVYGVLGSIEAIEEAVGDTLPSLELTIRPPSLAAAVALCQPGNQGSPVRIWLSVVDADTGQVVPSPDLLFAGEIDVPWLEQDKGELEVRMDIASAFEPMFEADEGMRLADSVHQTIHPGERGFANMTGVQVERRWGPGDRPSAATAVPEIPIRGVQRYF